MGVPDVNDLTPKERVFVLEYLVDGNGARAIMAAGYKCGNGKAAATSACKVLSRPRVNELVKHLQAKQREDFKIRAEEILWHLWASASRSAEQFVDDEGRLLLQSQNIRDLPPEINAAVNSIKQKEVRRYLDHEQYEIVEIETEVKLTDKIKAIELAMKHKGLFAADESEVTVRLDLDALSRAPVESNAVEARLESERKRLGIEKT
jgi:phage terminase small subunit